MLGWGRRLVGKVGVLVKSARPISAATTDESKSLGVVNEPRLRPGTRSLWKLPAVALSGHQRREDPVYCGSPPATGDAGPDITEIASLDRSLPTGCGRRCRGPVERTSSRGDLEENTRLLPTGSARCLPW